MNPAKRLRIDVDTKPKTISFLEQLPNEVFLQIFALLDLSEIVNAFSGMNKRFDSLISNLKYLSQVMSRNSIPMKDEMLHQYTSSIVRLVVDRMSKFSLTSVTLNNVRSLTIKYGSQTQYDDVRPSNFPLLEYLHIDDYPYSDCRKSIYDLYQVIVGNGFAQLRKCVANGLIFDSNEMPLWSGSSSIRSFRLEVKTTHDFDMILNACPYLHRLHLHCVGRQQASLNAMSSQTMIKHFELQCNHTLTPGIFLPRIMNLVALKLTIAAWPTHDVFEELATNLKQLNLQIFTCLVRASQIAGYPMGLEILNKNYIENLHPLFKYVMIDQRNDEYCVDGDDVEWNKYDFKMEYSIYESVEIKNFI